jgi:RNA ligase (TIGR02306 family)
MLHAQIQSVKKIIHSSNRFDLQVANNSNFYANGVLVHNSHVMMSVRPDGTAMVASKGLGARGFPFAEDDENIYNRVIDSLKVKDQLAAVANRMGADALILCGEIFGAGVQDLTYGCSAQVNPGYRAFDCAVVMGFDKFWMDSAELESLLAEIGVPRVPILYRGPYSLEVVKEYTSGKTTFGANHIREGIVINTLVERRHPKWGRAKLKSVSEDYLLRKGEVTEYQ